jgi:hypothetical protein
MFTLSFYVIFITHGMVTEFLFVGLAICDDDEDDDDDNKEIQRMWNMKCFVIPVIKWGRRNYN